MILIELFVLLLILIKKYNVSIVSIQQRKVYISYHICFSLHDFLYEMYITSLELEEVD